MRGKTILAILVILAVAFAATDLYASGRNRVGTAGAQELLIPVGARGIGLGGAATGDISGVEAIYYNPAGLSRMTNSAEAMFSHTSYLAGIGIDYGAIGAKFAGFGTLGFTLKSISFGDIPVTTEVNPDGTGANYSPVYTTLGITFARDLTDRIAAGVTVNLVHEAIMSTAANGVAFNAGLQYTGLGGVNGLKLGIALKNLGFDMQYAGSDLLRLMSTQNDNQPPQLSAITTASFGLPSQLDIGLSYDYLPAEDQRLSAFGLFQSNNFSDDEYRLAVEYCYSNLASLRASYQMMQTGNTADFTSPYSFTLGGGLHYNTGGVDVTLDYAYQVMNKDLPGFNANQVFSVKLGF